jgi:two-component system, sensor histidine kinase and response regulator
MFPINLKIRFLVLFLVLLLGGVLINQVDKRIESEELELRKIRIQRESELATKHFQEGVEKFSVLVSGIRSYILVHPDVPGKEEMYTFLKNQFNSLSIQDSIVVSYIDTNHIFQYSVTPSSLTPNNLAGKSVGSLREKEQLKALDALMTTDDLMMFPPINMVEGYIGVPINFRVVKNGKCIGYMACLANFKQIIDEIYREPSANEFVYHFSTNDGISFDRVAYYDGSTIYNHNQDPESYQHFNVAETKYVKNTFSSYGYQFNIGVAYKNPYHRSMHLTLALVSWLTLLGAFMICVLLYWRLETKEKELLELKNKDLKNANNALKNFAYASAHDLKEPLRSISSFSAILKKRYSGQLDQTAKEYLDFIINSTSKLGSLLEDLLQYAQLINAKHIPKEKVNLNSTMQFVQDSLSASIKEKKVLIKIGDLPVINANSNQMYQLFQNIISNAIKYNDKEQPEVTIGYAKDNRRFFIKDNGIGIAREYQENVFIAFQRLSKEISGSGVGLTICKTIVEQHDGKIWIESEPGQGTTFYFTLPEK